MLMIATRQAYTSTSPRASDSSSAQRSLSASIAASSSLVTFFIRMRLEWKVQRSGSKPSRARRVAGASGVVGVHRGQFFLGHLLHPHAAGMEGAAFRLEALARAQDGRDLGLHCGVGTRHDLADAEGARYAHGWGSWPGSVTGLIGAGSAAS